MGEQTSRSSITFCVIVLGLTAAGKILALAHGGGLLQLRHPFLPGNYELYVWLGLLVELAAFASLWLFGTRVFLGVCFGLAIWFVGYHAVEVYLRVEGRCPCLGGFLSRWKPLADSESFLSFLSACGLGVASYIALFPSASIAPPAPNPQQAFFPIVLSLCIWLLFGGLMVWLWQGRMLDGDEGMEAAKSLQLSLAPHHWSRVWNDHPPLLTMAGAWAFGVIDASMTTGRILVVLLGLAVPWVLGAYCSQAGVREAAPAAVILLWLGLPVWWAAFLLEAPAYALGLAALLPLILGGGRNSALALSAFLAGFALSVKLTAAFALVVPFSLLMQNSRRKALVWGLLSVALMMLNSWLLPNWSWTTMANSHLQTGVSEIQFYRIRPDAYASDWLICALALFGIAFRYSTNRLSAILPWLSAAGAALLIHFLHRPYFMYYQIHLLAPLAVVAAIGILDLAQLLRSHILSPLERKSVLVLFITLCFLWGWQQLAQIRSSYRLSLELDRSPIVKELRLLGKSGNSAFAFDPIWTFTAGLVQTPPELTITPMKRRWSGQCSHSMVTNLLASNRLSAITIPVDYLKFMEWSNFLSGYSETARSGKDVLFVRKDLRPNAIDSIEATKKWYRQMGL